LVRRRKQPGMPAVTCHLHHNRQQPREKSPRNSLISCFRAVALIIAVDLNDAAQCLSRSC